MNGPLNKTMPKSCAAEERKSKKKSNLDERKTHSNENWLVTKLKIVLKTSCLN